MAGEPDAGGDVVGGRDPYDGRRAQAVEASVEQQPRPGVPTVAAAPDRALHLV
jgi:hypothetical protein